MGTRIAVAVVVIFLCVGAWFGWQRYKQRQTEDGAVTCIGCMTPEEKARFDKENSGETADGNSEHKDRTARAEDAAGNPEGAVAAGQIAPSQVAPGQPIAPGGPIAAKPVVVGPTGSGSYPPAPVYGGTNQPVYPAAANYPAARTYALTGAAGAPPMADSQAFNAPNGMRFAGTGSYQWYRQGNLTWRVDTVAGSSCIAFATLEEWRKPIVYSHGCGRGA
jgi:hypothetical protein